MGGDGGVGQQVGDVGEVRRHPATAGLALEQAVNAGLGAADQVALDLQSIQLAAEAAHSRIQLDGPLDIGNRIAALHLLGDEFIFVTVFARFRAQLELGGDQFAKLGFLGAKIRRLVAAAAHAFLRQGHLALADAAAHHRQLPLIAILHVAQRLGPLVEAVLGFAVFALQVGVDDFFHDGLTVARIVAFEADAHKL